MAEAAVTHWKNKAIEAANRLTKFRDSIKEHSERASQVIVGTALTVGGGAIAGVLDEKMPTFPVLGGDSKMVVGGALVSLALLDVAGDYSEQMVELGSGMLAVVAHEQARKMLSK